jgi:hypothetical protein
VIVTAALAWFDERPEDLDRYVRSLAGFCDRLVAVDGPYERYPRSRVGAGLAEEKAIARAANAIGLDYRINTSPHIWRGQVEKRNYLYEFAAEGSDWIFTLDADHILHGPAEPFRHELEHVTADRVEVPFYTTPNYARPLAVTAATEWHENMVGQTIPTALLLRALPEMRVEDYHWQVSALKDGERVWVSDTNDPGRYPTTEAHTLEAPLLVEHRCMYRRDRNILGNRAFCADRARIVERTGQEDPVPA